MALSAKPAYGAGEQGRDSRSHAEPNEATLEPTAAELAGLLPRPDLHDPVVLLERQLLQVILQFPHLVPQAELEAVDPSAFGAPAHRAVFDGVVGAGLLPRDLSSAAWTAAVTQAAPSAVHGLVSELAVATLPVRMDKTTGQPGRRYVASLTMRLREMSLTRRISEALSQLRRLATSGEGDPAHQRELSVELQTLQRELAALRTQEED